MYRPTRKIIHIDMDAFYASVEQMDNPELRGKPVAVGGSSLRGVVAAASYDARKFGRNSAMPSSRAKQQCNHLIFIKPRFSRYREISLKIRNIFFEYTELVEPLSLDEAFLDVTRNKKAIPIATQIATEIRERIKQEIGLTASAGISINKFIAKVATEVNKPDGQLTIPPSRVETFLASLPIEKFFGVGKVTAKKMHALGISTGSDLKNLSIETLKQEFGKSGEHFFRIIRNQHDNPVRPNRIRKSVGAEHTYPEDITDRKLILDKLNIIADEVERRMTNSNSKGKTITIKIKFNDFNQQTRSKTITDYIQMKHDILPVVRELATQREILKPVRLLGISISNLYNNNLPAADSYQTQLSFKF